MKTDQIREQFLKYFERNGHRRVVSSSLVPSNDPTLFFTNAGMVQFKDLFLGLEKRDYKRATTSQKCMRVSGKHNDLENVGYTPRHHTFFEMLGNFSFQDYFKEDAIAFGWDFLTKEIGLPKDRFYVTVFTDDDEAAKIWEKHVPKDRIFRMGEKDNFWAMGDTGPCGPCSEIHFDKIPGKKVEIDDFESGRMMEIWNLVFMQFNRDAKGVLHKLEKPSVDTGMGLERLVAVIEGAEGNYETDLFIPIISQIEKICGRKYTRSYKDGANDDVAMRVIADHIRASVFLIGDGVQPSNEGRGYVLRRIMRRAIRYGRKLGVDAPFFHKIAHVVIDEMGPAFPEIITHKAFIEKVIFHEEKSFFETLDKGLEILDGAFAELMRSKSSKVPGDIVFKLYDTFGFPKDLTADIAQEHSMKIDEEGFETLMEEQREKARGAWKGSGEESVEKIYKELQKRGVATDFVGYECATIASKVLAIVKEGVEVDSASEGDEVHFILDRTPFYGESGGQIGDTGVVVRDGLEIEITDVKRPFPSMIVHIGNVTEGTLKKGDDVSAAVDSDCRNATRRNHTATHLLHKALREVLGPHVRQAGSYVGPDRLRFDFSHFAALTKDELRAVEENTNEIIRRNVSLCISVKSREKAVAEGAMAFFGEKYGEQVRVVDVPGFSMELCGGTHVDRTGDIGMVKILSESSVASGVRRLEAVTGRGAELYVQELEDERRKLAEALKVNPAELAPRVKKILEQMKLIEKDLEAAKSKLASGASEDLMSQVKDIGGVKLLAVKVDATDPKELRSLSDVYKEKIGSGIVVLGAQTGEKVAFIVTVSKDLTSRFNAGNIMKELAKVVSGTGGGRPDMAQGGGPDISKLSEALNSVEKLIKG